jgi:hypothetical protein
VLSEEGGIWIYSLSPWEMVGVRASGATSNMRLKHQAPPALIPTFSRREKE